MQNSKIFKINKNSFEWLFLVGILVITLFLIQNKPKETIKSQQSNIVELKNYSSNVKVIETKEK